MLGLMNNFFDEAFWMCFNLILQKLPNRRVWCAKMLILLKKLEKLCNFVKFTPFYVDLPNFDFLPKKLQILPKMACFYLNLAKIAANFLIFSHKI